MDVVLSVYRFDPEAGTGSRMQDYHLSGIADDAMLLDCLLAAKAEDESLSFRRSCGEGVCGSDAVNINGRNGLACITPVAGLEQPVVIRPLPGLAIIRDLVVDMEPFYRQYRAIKPYLQVNDPEPEVEFLQTPAERERLDGLYECILCGCCSTSCPSFWWNPERFRGPAALLQACRFIEDSRDQEIDHRLEELDDAYKLFRCHTIMNCVDACPKGLNPTEAIGRIKKRLLRRSV